MKIMHIIVAILQWIISEVSKREVEKSRRSITDNADAEWSARFGVGMHQKDGDTKTPSK